MYQLGIFTGYDLKQKPLEYLEKHFRNSGFHYYQICRGIHNSEVKPNRKIKSVGANVLLEKIYLPKSLWKNVCKALPKN